jgi:hypothetical protein
MRELPLAELVPLWRTVREARVTALVTPALDYVGGLELGTKDVRFESDEGVAALGEGLRSLVSTLDERTSLLFLYQVTTDVEADISEYEAICSVEEPAALKSYVAARAAWLRGQRLRRTRLFLFFSRSTDSLSALGRGALGRRLAFANVDRLSEERHGNELQLLTQLRDRIASRLGQLGIASRDLDELEVRQLHYELLNPVRSREQLRAPAVAVQDDLWDDATLAKVGDAARAFTEAEQLCHEGIEDGRGYFKHADVYRRALTLKVLPEAGTDYFASEPLLDLALQRGATREPMCFTLAVALQVVPQAAAKWNLNVKHKLVDALRVTLPFLQGGRSVEQETTDQAHQESIQELFAELTSMMSKLVNLSVTLLLEARSLDELDAQTEAARAAFNAIGNSELYTEDLSQVPAFLSMLPGSGAYQLRKKGCTSRNAGDFLPVFAAWRGCARAASLLSTPNGDAFKLDLFDKSLSAAHHGLVAADTGSGKSVSLGALTLDALASGLDAILVDNGGSWKPLTELMGGVFLPVSLRTSICPFASYADIAGDGGEIDPREIEQVVHFLDLCTTDQGKDGFGIVETDLVSRAVRGVYESSLRSKPSERPLISRFRDALASYGTTVQDQELAQSIARRLNIYCDGLYGEFLNRESPLRFDAKLLTFDLAQVSQNPMAKKLAMATVMQAIGNRAAARRNRTLVEIDEAHEYLGTDAVAERFIAGCYRKMRKFDVAMWMISQNLGDFINSRVGDAIVGNAHLKILLKHGKGASQDRVVSYFKLSRRAAEAFANLDRRAGHYSDFFLIYGGLSTTVRLALHPLAYWILTTDPNDRELIERASARNPQLGRLEVLEALADRFPHGVAGQRVRQTG